LNSTDPPPVEIRVLSPIKAIRAARDFESLQPFFIGELSKGNEGERKDDS
jgi:hypothetical protein